jgi:two-component system chemotaxis response regulator CheB
MTVRALVIDDSPTMRAMVAHVLSRDAGIEVVGTADGPVAARAMIKQLDPDVVTLDVEMPGMNGLEFLDKIMRLRPMPVVMLSTLTSRGADTSIRALELGAFDCFAKPTRWTEGIGAALTEMVRTAGSGGRRPRHRTVAARPPAEYRPREGAMIAIGASTGGVEALIELLQGFPENCPPTVICQHMPASFTASFAARLDRLALPRVIEARPGAPMAVGNVYLAPGGTHHLEIIGRSQPRCHLVEGDRVSGHRPSVDRLFHSVAKVAGGSAVGAILTGMGGDGAQGLKAMRDAGAVTIGQDEESSLVYGMPAVAWATGGVETQLPLSRIAPRLLLECRA